MTLALGVFERDTVYLISDTKLSYEVDRNPVPGVEARRAGLKTFFLTPQIAVAYAGTVSTAHQTFMRARTASVAGATPSELAELFREHCRETPENEYLLAACTNGRQLFKITPTVFSETSEGVRWIGSAGAANYILNEPFDSAFILSRRFQQALDERRVDDVGGRAVMARGNAQGIKFIPEMGLVSPVYRPSLESEWQTVDWGDAAAGGFAYTTIVPTEVGRNGWGIHFFQGFCGYFWKIDFDRDVYERLRWENTTTQNAIAALQTDLGFRVEGGGQLAGG
jgi:hypothetical protein